MILSVFHAILFQLLSHAIFVEHLSLLRAMRATELNSESSRSHTILQLFVSVEEPDDSGVVLLKRATLSLVDLAGSEKWRMSLSNTNLSNSISSQTLITSSTTLSNATANNIANSTNNGTEIREMANINSSLHVLGNVVSALIEPGRKHIPFRDSLLTRLLQDSLGGSGRTVLLATIHHPLDTRSHHREETLSTLQVYNFKL